jgi:hypothetical protein
MTEKLAKLILPQKYLKSVPSIILGSDDLVQVPEIHVRHGSRTGQVRQVESRLAICVQNGAALLSRNAFSLSIAFSLRMSLSPSLLQKT